MTTITAAYSSEEERQRNIQRLLAVASELRRKINNQAKADTKNAR